MGSLFLCATAAPATAVGRGVLVPALGAFLIIIHFGHGDGLVNDDWFIKPTLGCHHILLSSAPFISRGRSGCGRCGRMLLTFHLFF
jgi:hypothetical protein